MTLFGNPAQTPAFYLASAASVLENTRDAAKLAARRLTGPNGPRSAHDHQTLLELQQAESYHQKWKQVVDLIELHPMTDTEAVELVVTQTLLALPRHHDNLNEYQQYRHSGVLQFLQDATRYTEAVKDRSLGRERAAR